MGSPSPLLSDESVTRSISARSGDGSPAAQLLGDVVQRVGGLVGPVLHRVRLRDVDVLQRGVEQGLKFAHAMSAPAMTPFSCVRAILPLPRMKCAGTLE